jgi:flagellar hook assembly protein FlgD
LQRLLTTVTLVGLLVATAAAFAVTERLKLTKSPVFATVVYPKTGFSPKCGCARGKTTIRVKLRRGDDVTVRILDRQRREVSLLVDGLHVTRGANAFRWDGRTNAGAIAPDGVYKAEIHLVGQHRTIVLPNEIVLDTTAPEVKNVTVNRDTFSPDGDHQADFVRITYELSKPAHVQLYLGDTRILRTHRHSTRASFSWYGLDADGRPLPSGSYGLQLGAVDAAGNSTPVAKRWHVRVRVRFIMLASKRIAVRAGARFSIGVSTDAKRYTWKLGGRKSFATGPVLHLLASTRRGRYTLTVAERGHVDRATVLVK